MDNIKTQMIDDNSRVLWNNDTSIYESRGHILFLMIGSFCSIISFSFAIMGIVILGVMMSVAFQYVVPVGTWLTGLGISSGIFWALIVIPFCFRVQFGRILGWIFINLSVWAFFLNGLFAGVIWGTLTFYIFALCFGRCEPVSSGIVITFQILAGVLFTFVFVVFPLLFFGLGMCLCIWPKAVWKDKRIRLS